MPRKARQKENPTLRAALLEELKDVARKLGFTVREERLLREVGYHVRSGSCRLRDRDVLLIDRTLPPEAQIDVLVEELAGRPLDEIYLSPAARALLERAASRCSPDSAPPDG